MRTAITGFAQGSSVSLSVTQHGQSKNAQTDTWNVDPMSSILPALNSGMWTLEDEGSATKHGIAQLNIISVPAFDGWEIDGFICEVNDGVSTSERLIHWGGVSNKIRRVKLDIGTAYSISIRIRWRQKGPNGTPLANLFTYEISDTSDIKTVLPTAIAQPSVTITSMLTNDRSAPVGNCYYLNIAGFGVTRPEHDLRIIWDYGDTRSTHKRLRQEFIDTHGNDANTSHDFIGVHTFESPGTYTVTATVTNGTETATATFTEVVLNANDEFRVDRTVYVRKNGDFSDLTAEIAAGALTATNLAAANTLTANNREQRIYVRRGDDFSADSKPTIRRDHIRIEPYGTGADPILPPVFLRGDGFVSGGGDVCITGCWMKGDYDPSAPSVSDTQTGGLEVWVEGLTLHNCKLSGFYTTISPDPRRLVISSTYITDWGNYGILMPDGKPIGLCGTTIAQNPLTIRKDGKAETAPVYSDHGPFRMSRPNGAVVFSKCDFFSCNSWAGASTSVQLGIRWNAGGVAGQQLLVSQCMTEGGSAYFGATSSPTPATVVDAVISKHYHISALGGLYGTGFSGISFHNCIGVVPDHIPETNVIGTSLYAGHGYGSTVLTKGQLPNEHDAPNNPIRFKNMTILDLRTQANSQNVAMSNGPRSFVFSKNEILDGIPSEYAFADVEVANSAHYVPFLTNGIDDGPFDLSARFDGRYLGRVFDGENLDVNGVPQLQPAYANAGAGIIPVPQPASIAIGDGDPSTSLLDDFTGSLRGNSPSLGALEPD